MYLKLTGNFNNKTNKIDVDLTIAQT
jgi:hypothetical protein